MAIKFEKIPVTSSGQIFTIKKTDGSTIQTDLAGLLNERKLGTIDDIPVPPTTPPPAADPCAPLAPLGCTDLEQQAQNQSLVLILNDMAGLDASTLQYPVQIHLVRLCDGSTAYILDQFLGDLEGSHLTIGSITVTSPDQLFNVTAVQPEPIFAMAFNHEANGNISRAEWQTTFHRSQFYDYAYDPLNRLLSAQYGEVVPSYAVVGGAFQKFVYQINNNYNENNLTYDGDGNIKTLQRMGLSDANNCASKVQIDNLLYTLIPGTPKLQKVADSAPAANRAKGFNPGASPGSDYVYDQNGNLTTDPYKGLTIQYNFLNLPKLITKGGSNITIRYDVTGRKWSQAGPEGIREYIGGIEYLDQKIQSIRHSEGRLVPTYSGTSIESIRAEYWRQDHLGNTRIAFSDFNLDGVIATKDDPNTTEDDIEITQENHYYPFGLNQEGPWYQTVQPKNKHQYNGKELIEDLGLNWNDYGARWYDPALGRWNMMDPLAGEFYAWSPFSYVYNNPIIFVDPFGLAGNLTDGATFYLQKGDITDDEFWSAVLNYVSNVINVWGIENEQNLSKVSFKFVDESFSADQLTGNENLVSFGTGDKVSNVSGKNNEIGFINIKDISDGNTPAHEFGHHLGLSDRYFDGVTWNQSSGELGRKTDPISGEEIPDNAYNPDDNLYSTQTSTLTLYQIAIAHTTAIEADYQQNRGYFYSVRKSGEVIYKEGYRVVDGVGGGNARVKGGRELSRKGSTNEKIKEEIITQKRY
ncbi:MAG: RHS repeat-associated core domain-containing protein [Lewinella sp.]|nr:RHS repeat-associated core domain-containing protein [Lewinella sp.]